MLSALEFDLQHVFQIKFSNFDPLSALAIQFQMHCHLIDHVDQLAEFQILRLRDMRSEGIENPQLRHVTRNMPKRADEVLDGANFFHISKVLW